MAEEGRYCCEKKCFIAPQWQVDGIACRVCEGFSYCQCACETYKRESWPELRLEAIKLYRTRHYFACCPLMCNKLPVEKVVCSKCYPKTFCECIFKGCKTRNDWST